MTTNYTLEVCVDSIESALAAQEGGADRIELCTNLYEGGTTPSAAVIELARKYLDLKIHVMIRPRGGDFLYSQLEFDIMKREIEVANKLKADGVVFGILNEDGTIDINRTKELVELAKPMTVAFHRAFDMTRDPYKALEDVIQTGANILLTSGMMNEAPTGALLITSLIKRAKGRIRIMPGAGINKDNIKDMINITGASEYHLTGASIVKSAMKYRNPKVFMGGIPEIPEYERSVTNVVRIKSVISSLREAELKNKPS